MIDSPPVGPLPGTPFPATSSIRTSNWPGTWPDMIAGIIRERAAQGQKAVLGLPTGSTPVGIYRELVRLHREEGLDFSNVVTFNLDEYLRPGARPAAKLPPLDARALLQARQHPGARTSTFPTGSSPPDKLDEHCR